jgi:hypothetical protein
MKSLFNLATFFFLSIAMIAFIGCDKDDTATPTGEEPTSLRVGLVGHWDFLGNANDLSTKGYHGAVVGAIPAKDRKGKDNSAFQFNGETDYIQLGNITSLGFGGFTPYTIASWVKPDSAFGTIISKWNGGVKAGWYLRVKPDGITTSYRNVVPWTSNALEPIQPNKWYHLLTKYDGSQLYIYVNGELVAQDPFTSQPNDTQTNVLVGALYSQHQVASFFKGVIDEVRIYDRDLTNDEIKWLATH